MSDKYSCINLGVKLSVNHIISFILRDLGMQQNRPVVKFGDSGFFSMPDLYLLWVNLGSTAKPSFCYP